MFLDDKYKISKDNQECTKFILKVLPQYLELKDRKKLKKQIIEIKLLYQMSDNEIPNLEDEKNVYKTIMVVEFKVIDIKKTLTFIEIIHKLFKAPTIVKIVDNKNNYLYSFSNKRLNKLDNNEIIIDNIVNTQIFNEISNYKIKEEYENILECKLNKNNKYEYYYEIMLKTLLYNNKNILDKDIYIKVINSNVFYDIFKMENLFFYINKLINLNQEYVKCDTIGDKIKIKNEIKDIQQKIK